MIRGAISVASMAAWAVLLVSTAASADPRGVSTVHEPATPEQVEARRVQTVRDMQTWLRRLTGRFRYVGVDEVPTAACIQIKPKGRPAEPMKCQAGRPRDAEGVWDCVNIGKGSGVHCVIGSTAQRRDPTKPNLDGPTMILLGIDPDIPAIRYMQLNEDGIAAEYLGHLRGNAVIFNAPCIPPEGNNCSIEIKITAPTGAPIHWKFDKTRLVFDEYRSTQRLNFELLPSKQDQPDKPRELEQ